MKNLIFVGACILISGCSSSGSQNIQLIGKWLTESCEQATDSNGVSVDAWFKSEYEFTATGFIFFVPEHYTDAQCITKAQTQTTVNPDLVVTHTDQGKIILQEGIPGYGITLSFETPNETIAVDGFYTINSGVLCFSGIFNFGTLRFGFSEVAGDSAINFDDCLAKL